MNTGTRLTLLQSKDYNLYAVKHASGWDLLVLDTTDGTLRNISRELSSRRVNVLLTALSQIDVDQTLPIPYTPGDPFLDTSEETLDRVFGPVTGELPF